MNVYRIEGLTGEAVELAALWDLGCLGVQEEEGPGGLALLAYFEEKRALPVPGEWLELPDVDYVARYQAGLGPVRFGRLVVAPSHSRVELVAGELALWLDPGSAFGTGHHETTAMALKALTRLDLAGKSVLDLGAGSGLLAIAADRLGAEQAYGVDNDVATIGVARENAARNSSRARFAPGTLDTPGLPGHFDVVVANLYAELHRSLFPTYVSRVVAGGRLILSGILAQRRQLVEEAAPPSAELVGEDRAGDWLLLEYEVEGSR